jgi:hypothetical protein
VPRDRVQALVDRPYRLVVLDLPTRLVRASGAEKEAICERLEALLDRQVRIVLSAPGEIAAMDREVCRHIRGLSKVFLFVWTAGAELFGFDQTGRPVPLAEARKDDPAAVARYVIDAVADPAEITLEEILVVGEQAEAGGVKAFTSDACVEVQRVALTDQKKVPPGIHRADCSHKTVVRLLDGLLWKIG